jgi:single-strand DNA-binding protein
MASVNKVTLLGNVGRDPEIRYMADGKAVCNLSIATTSRRKDKNTGEAIEDTQWHRVTLYERLAEIAGEYVKKGKPVYIEGRLKYGKYTDQAGVEKNTCDVIATELQLLGGRDDAQPAPKPQAARPAPPPAGGFAEDDDDIPL